MIGMIGTHPTDAHIPRLFDGQVHAEAADHRTEPIPSVHPGGGRRLLHHHRNGRCAHGARAQVVQVHFQPIHAVAEVAAIIGRYQQIGHELGMDFGRLAGHKAFGDEALRLRHRDEVTVQGTCRWGTERRYNIE